MHPVHTINNNYPKCSIITLCAYTLRLSDRTCTPNFRCMNTTFSTTPRRTAPIRTSFMQIARPYSHLLRTGGPAPTALRYRTPLASIFTCGCCWRSCTVIVSDGPLDLIPFLPSTLLLAAHMPDLTPSQLNNDPSSLSVT